MKLALVQMLVEPGEPNRNLDRACQRIKEAVDMGSDVVLLPEALDYGWMNPSARNKPEGIDVLSFLEAAGRYGIYVCAGLIERRGRDLYNAAVLIDPAGDIRLHHRKINELEIALDLYTKGETVSEPIETEFGRIGIHICADAFAEEQWIGRQIGGAGADLILSPCAWAVSPDFDSEMEVYGGVWRENYGPVARDYHCSIAGCSNVGPISDGPWVGHRCIGNSIVFDSNGQEVLTGPFNEEAILVVDL